MTYSVFTRSPLGRLLKTLPQQWALRENNALQLTNMSARYIGYKHKQYNKYTLLDGLTYNTSGYFASCVVFFRAP